MFNFKIHLNLSVYCSYVNDELFKYYFNEFESLIAVSKHKKAINFEARLACSKVGGGGGLSHK